MAKLAIKEGPHVQDRDIMDPKNMEADFMSFLDKEKARSELHQFPTHFQSN
jgi:hypothetical protein